MVGIYTGLTVGRIGDCDDGNNMYNRFYNGEIQSRIASERSLSAIFRYGTVISKALSYPSGVDVSRCKDAKTKGRLSPRFVLSASCLFWMRRIKKLKAETEERSPR